MKKSLVFISICIVVAALVGCLPTAFALAEGNVEQTLSTYLEERQAEYVGVAYYVFDDNQSGGYGVGYFDAQNKGETDIWSTVYDWGELSELFVWYSLNHLAAGGKIDLSQPIGTYVQGIKTPKGEPSVADLMSHTAGFANIVADLYADDDEDVKPLSETVLRTPDQLYAPHEKVAYSVYDATLGAYIVEKVSGLSYEDYVRQNLIVPLGLERTAVGADLWDNAQTHASRNLTVTYDALGNSAGISRLLSDYYPAIGAAGTIRDLYLVAQAIADGLLIRNGLNELNGDVGIRVSTIQSSQAAIAIDFASKKGLVILTNSPQRSLAEGMIAKVFGNVNADIPLGFYRPQGKVNQATAFGWVNLLDVRLLGKDSAIVCLAVNSDGTLLTESGVYEPIPTHELAVYGVFIALFALSVAYAFVVLVVNTLAAIARACHPIADYPVRLQRWQTTAAGTILLIDLIMSLAYVTVALGNFHLSSMLWKSWVLFGLALVALGHVVVLPFIARKQPCGKKRVGLYCLTAFVLVFVLGFVVLSGMLAF